MDCIRLEGSSGQPEGHSIIQSGAARHGARQTGMWYKTAVQYRARRIEEGMQSKWDVQLLTKEATQRRKEKQVKYFSELGGGVRKLCKYSQVTT